MAQAGILGNLEYIEDQHGWALDLGHQSARYELISGSLTDQQVPGLEEARRDIVKDMNNILTNNRVRYTIPELVPGIAADHRQVCGDLLEFMRRDTTSTLLAFYLIGTAVYFLGIRAASDSKHEGEMSDMALNRLQNIIIRCPGIQIDLKGLLECFLANDISPIGIRLLLSDLQKPLIILLVAADPLDLAPLRLQQEFRQLIRALQGAKIKNAFRVELLPDCRPGDLASGLRLHKPTILHFSGHGSKDGPCFVGRNGEAVVIEPSRLAGLLELACSEGLKGVVMNACYTERHAECIAEVVGAVVAMDGPIDDEDAILFAKEFYGCLGDGYAFEKSFQWALMATGLVESAGPLKPCLIKARPRGSRSTTHSHSDMNAIENVQPGDGVDEGDTPQDHAFASTNASGLKVLTVPSSEVNNTLWVPSIEGVPQAENSPYMEINAATDSFAGMSIANTAIATHSSDLTAAVRPGGRHPPPIPPKRDNLKSGKLSQFRSSDLQHMHGKE